MQMRIIATDGGKHSDAKLAKHLADEIIQIGAKVTDQDPDEWGALQAQIAEILTGHFEHLANIEHLALTANGSAHLASSLDPHPTILDDATSHIVEAIETAKFAGGTANMVRANVARYLGIAQHMHRDWFARHGKVGHGRELTDHPSHSPDCPHVRRWIAMHAGDTLARHEHAAALVEAA